jgi:hypothetical protein
MAVKDAGGGSRFKMLVSTLHIPMMPTAISSQTVTRGPGKNAHTPRVMAAVAGTTAKRKPKK